MQNAPPRKPGSFALYLALMFTVFVLFQAVAGYLFPAPKDPLKTVHRDAAQLLGGGGILGEKRFFELPAEGTGGETTWPAAPDAGPAKPEPGKPEPAKPAPAASTPPEFVGLGVTPEGAKPYALRVILSRRGAGVQQVILPAFDEASRLGREVKDEAGKAVPLHLIPGVYRPLTLAVDDPYVPPTLQPGTADPKMGLSPASYRLFHYESADDTRPVNTLGVRDWDVAEVSNDPASDTQKVVFQTEVGAPHHVRVRKTFTLHRRDYHVGMRVDVSRLDGQAGKPFRYQVSGPLNMPIEGEWYTGTYRNVLLGAADQDGNISRLFEDAYSVAYKGASLPQERTPGSAPRYAAVATQFFASAIVVDTKQPDNGPQTFLERTRGTPERLGRKPTPGQPDLTRPGELDDVTVRAVTEPLALEKPAAHAYMLYQGPAKVRLLHQLRDPDGTRAVDYDLVDRYKDELGLATITDYQMPGPIGAFARFIMWTPLTIATTNLMHWLLGMLTGFLPYGLAIMGLTVIVRGALLPVSYRQAAGMQKFQDKMAKVQPELKRLQEQFSDDPQRMKEEQMRLYMRHGINPFVMMGGCLLLLLQMPIIMGLYYCLQENAFFRLAPFLWIPNLAAPDMTIWWSESIPLISAPEWRGVGICMGISFYLGPFFNVLPFVAMGLMLYQQIKTMPPPADEQAAANAMVMKYMMVLMAFMFYKVAAGLVLYFIVTTLWGLGERYMIKRSIARQATTATGNAIDADGAIVVQPKAAQTSGPTPIEGKRKKDKRGKPKGGQPPARKDDKPAGPPTMMERLRDWAEEQQKKKGGR